MHVRSVFFTSRKYLGIETVRRTFLQTYHKAKIIVNSVLMIEICSLLQKDVSFKLKNIMLISNGQLHCLFQNVAFDVKYAIINIFDW